MGRNGDNLVGSVRRIDGAVGRALAGGWAPEGATGSRGAEI